MTDKPKALAGLEDSDAIPLFTFRDMRMLSLKIPEHLVEAPDDHVMALPRKVAEPMFLKALERWRIPESEAESFKANSGAFEIMRILQIHQYLLLISRSMGIDLSEWMHANNKRFDGKTPWAVIRDGRIEDVFNYLDGFVFDGWSPLINPFYNLEKEHGDE